MDNVRYRITSVNPRPTFTTGGKPIDVYDVFFEEVSSGFGGQVSIPVTEYTADRVHAEVYPRAVELAKTAKLGQG